MKYTIPELWNNYMLQEDKSISYINKGDRVLINSIETLLDGDHECKCIDTLKKAGHIHTITDVERLDIDFWQYILDDGTILFDSDIEFVFKEE